MLLYPEAVITKIKARPGIVSVITGYTKLTGHQGLYYGQCPFHPSTSQLLLVDKKRQTFRCLECGVGGNVIAFVMHAEHCSFTEAVQKLAKLSNIQLPSIAAQTSDTQNDIITMNTRAARFYCRNLYNTGNNDGIRYLRNREITEGTMKKFGLGLSKDYGDAVYRILREKGYNDESIAHSGLVVVNEGLPHDRFWNRIMFPIMDEDGRVIGFGGRTLKHARAKYLNTPETPVFNKGSHLYGLHLAKQTKRPYLILCEGYMDVISLHQAGFDNAVASLGTALTKAQAELLAKYTKAVYLAYDSDAAGVNAANRAIPILERAGLNVRVISLGEHKDPDEYIKRKSVSAFEQSINEAETADRFRVRHGDTDLAVNILLKYL